MQTKQPTQEQLAAIISFARDNGRNWKAELRDSWMTGNYSGRNDGNYLQQVRNQFGPTWLINFKLSKALIEAVQQDDASWTVYVDGNRVESDLTRAEVETKYAQEAE